MRYAFCHSAVLVFTLLLLACSNENRQAATLLARTATIIEQHPDSALLLLDSIALPDKLNDALRMEYELRRVQARDKMDLDITADTMLFKVADFFLQREDVKKLALAEFYSGRIHQEQKKYEEATRDYLLAIDHARQVADNDLQGMACYNLGGLNSSLLFVDEAIGYYKQAYKCFYQQSSKVDKKALTLTSIGRCFLLNKQQDSAIHYFEKGLELAQQRNDSTLQSSICQSVGLALREKGEVTAAHPYLLRAAHLGVSTPRKVRLYRNLANSYLSQGKRDSALYYAQQPQQSLSTDTAPTSLSNTYELLANIEEAFGNYKKALAYHKQSTDYLDAGWERVLDNSILEVQKKYQMELLQNEHNRKTILQQRIIMGSLGLLLAAALACFLIYRRYQQTKERLQGKEQEMVVLMEHAKGAEDREKMYKEQADFFEAKERTLLETEQQRAKMLCDMQQQRLSTLKKASLLKSGLSPDSKGKLKNLLPQFDLAIYGSKDGNDWQLLYTALNELYNGLLDRFRQQLPMLSEAEFKVCCLSYAQFDITETSIVLNVSNKTILNHRTSIRKKLGLADSGDINAALSEIKQC